MEIIIETGQGLQQAQEIDRELQQENTTFISRVFGVDLYEENENEDSDEDLDDEHLNFDFEEYDPSGNPESIDFDDEEIGEFFEPNDEDELSTSIKYYVYLDELDGEIVINLDDYLENSKDNPAQKNFINIILKTIEKIVELNKEIILNILDDPICIFKLQDREKLSMKKLRDEIDVDKTLFSQIKSNIYLVLRNHIISIDHFLVREDVKKMEEKIETFVEQNLETYSDKTLKDWVKLYEKKENNSNRISKSAKSYLKQILKKRGVLNDKGN